MSEQDNLLTIRKVIDALNRHNADASVQYFASDVKGMAPDSPDILNRDQIRQYNQRFMQAVPDLYFEIKDLVAQGERAAVSWTVRGTHKAPLELATGGTIPATDKPIRVPGVTICEFREGVVIRQEVYWDQVAFLTQIGLLTPQIMTSMLQR